jgi:hypothetical protein
MRPDETSVNGSWQAVQEALARKRAWEEHGPSQWGYGVAIDLLALERRVSALERLSGAGKSAGEDNDSPGEGWRCFFRRRIDAKTNHDAAPAARAPTDASPLRSGSGVTAGMGTGDTQDEPVAFAVMSGGRAYDIYDTRGEAGAICRWLCEEESSDIWRVVPLVPADATPESHATYGECSLPPECTQPVAWWVTLVGRVASWFE